MTKGKVIEAGREMDALIAEKVMGWKWWAFRVADVESDCFARYLGERPIRDRDREWDGEESILCGDATRDVPNYSKHVGDAWLVVEKLCPTANRLDPWFQLYTSDGQWYANFHTGSLDVSAPTAPLAICLAALAAVEPK